MGRTTRCSLSDEAQGRKFGSKDPTPIIPGLTTKGSAKRIQRAVEHGRVGAAWRQLWSYDIAPSTSHTMQSVLSKWKTMLQDPCPPVRNKLPQITRPPWIDCVRRHSD
eukprot:1901829-Amphidinium_carterae.5